MAGLRATHRVNTRNSGFTCDQHTTTDTESAKTQTHSAETACFQRFSPNESALWPHHHRKLRAHRRQSGELHYTRVQHAVGQLLMPQNLINADPRSSHTLQDRRRLHNQATEPTSDRPEKENRTQFPTIYLLRLLETPPLQRSDIQFERDAEELHATQLSSRSRITHYRSR